MTLTEILNPSPWEAFHAAHSWSQFAQSWAWGEFRRSRGFDVRRFALISPEGKWNAAFQCEYRPKKFVGGYWFAPRGPVFAAMNDEDTRHTFETCVLGLEEKQMARALFWRFEPCIELGKPEGLVPPAFRRNNPVNPSSTILLDCTQSQDELLRGMHHKTRYNIRVADRHGVTTRLATQPDDIESFFCLLKETSERDEFTQHGEPYLRALLASLEKEGMARIRVAELNGKMLAANLEVLYGDTVTYLHGASSNDARNVMAPYALHWDAIMQAARDGYHIYDFWGVNPKSKAAFAYKPSWEGITRFKTGWGGRQVDLVGTWDLPFQSLLYALAFPRMAWRG